MAERFEHINKKLEELDESTREAGELLKESEPEKEVSVQISIENKQPVLAKVHNQPGVVYDTSLEHSLENMKSSSIFFSVKGKIYCDIYWNGFPAEKLS